MALTDFVGYMKNLKDISLADATLQKEDDPGKRDAAKAYLDVQGLKGTEELPQELRLDPAQLDAEERKAYVGRGLAVRQGKLVDFIGNSLNGPNLEGILNEINPKALEELALVKELGRAEVKGYEELLGNYQAYLSAKQLEQKYKAGQIGDDERKAIVGSAAEEMARDAIEKKKKEGGLSKQTMENYENLARLAAQLQAVKKEEYIVRGIKSIVSNAEKQFNEYQTNSGKTLLGYVKDSLKALRDDPDPDDSILARELIYQAATKKVA